MATKLQSGAPTPARSYSDSTNGYTSDYGSQPITAVIYAPGREDIVQLVAEVLGRACTLVKSLKEVVGETHLGVVGILVEDAIPNLESAERPSFLAINAHCVDSKTAPAEKVTEACDYEFLYSQNSLLRRDLTRFLAQVLGQSKPHKDLSKKKRTTFISTTFPDVRTALSNLDILSVGSDAVEIRVDLLKEPLTDGSVSGVPSLQYVGEQVMLLRSRTELPIIFTTRCVKENGKFPMEDPGLYHRYLYRAIQWGVEYIDVELWLPEDIRKNLWEKRGNSTIMSAFHDFSGQWKWTTPEAYRLFSEGEKYAHIVKMIAMIKTMDENYELEFFRSNIKGKSSTPLAAVNMGPMGQLSRALNTVFSPITHPLLPIIAAPGQLSAAEINGALHIMGQLPKRDMYAIGNFRSTPQSMFFEKCFNELGLPHGFACVERGPRGGSVEPYVVQDTFGGAYINPPLSLNSCSSYIPSASIAASAIGLVDTIVVETDPESHQKRFVGENAMWWGIRATLTRDYVPSAYRGRAAIILASSDTDAAPVIYALRSLDIGTIYTVGFKAPSSNGTSNNDNRVSPSSSSALFEGLEPFTSVDSVKRVEQPFVIVSAFSPEKSNLAQPLLRHYGAATAGGSHSRSNSVTGLGLASGANSGVNTPRSRGRVFLDLANGNGPRKGDPLAVAATAGWTAYGIADVSAWTTVETLRLLVGQNVPFDFVRMASGRGVY